jgi:hypothetical protein
MGWVVNAKPRPLYPREKLGTYCIGGWVGHRAGLDGCGKACPPPGLDPRAVQLVASRYTACASPAHQNPSSRWETYSIFQVSVQNPTCTDLGSNSGLSGERPATHSKRWTMIIYTALVKYLIKHGYTMGQCVRYLQTSRRPTIQLQRRYCIIFSLRILPLWKQLD